jgi:hypothetical protein
MGPSSPWDFGPTSAPGPWPKTVLIMASNSPSYLHSERTSQSGRPLGFTPQCGTPLQNLSQHGPPLNVLPSSGRPWIYVLHSLGRPLMYFLVWVAAGCASQYRPPLGYNLPVLAAPWDSLSSILGIWHPGEFVHSKVQAQKKAHLHL